MKSRFCQVKVTTIKYKASHYLRIFLLNVGRIGNCSILREIVHVILGIIQTFYYSQRSSTILLKL